MHGKKIFETREDGIIPTPIRHSLSVIMDLTVVSNLAKNRGCILKSTLMDDIVMYWVENSLFIGRPYTQLDDVAMLLQRLPDFPVSTC